MLNIENEVGLCERYSLTPTELFGVKVILLAQNEGEYEWIQRFAQIVKLRSVLENLREKEIILKSWKLPKEGSKLEIEDIPFNKNFIKQFYRASFEMGEELFNAYPQFITISGINYNARRISKKFDSLEDAFSKYGKAIKYDNGQHQQILSDIQEGIEKGYNFTTLDDFITDRAWTALHAFLNGEGHNVNVDAVKMI